MTEIIIERAKPRDFEAIFKLEEMSYKDPWPREVFIVDFLFNSSAQYYVAKSSGKIVGFLGIWQEEDRLHIINVTVHPEEREKGIGKTLIKYAIELARERKKKEVYLEARVSNTIAISLYKSMGFEETERINSYYQDGEDGIRLRLAVEEKS